MTSVQSMGSRGSILLGPGHSRMELLSVPTGPWNRPSSLCSTRLAFLCHSGVRLSPPGTPPRPSLPITHPPTPIPHSQTPIPPLLQRKQPRNPPASDWKENQYKVKNAEQFRDKPKRIRKTPPVEPGPSNLHLHSPQPSIHLHLLSLHLFLLNHLFPLSSPFQAQSLYLHLLVSSLPLILSLPPVLLHHLQPSGNTEIPLLPSLLMMKMIAMTQLRLLQKRMKEVMRMMRMMLRKRKKRTALTLRMIPMTLLLMTPSTPLPMPMPMPTYPPSLSPGPSKTPRGILNPA